MTNGMAPVSDLVHRLEMLTTQPLGNDTVEQGTFRLKNHYLYSTMFSIFVDLKERTRMVVHEEDEKDPQIRLDNMLAAEGVIGPEKDCPVALNNQPLDQDDYRYQLHNIRLQFQTEMAEREFHQQTFINNTRQVMKLQSETRPISELDLARVESAVKKKLVYYQIQLKQETCEQIMTLKSKFCDARRKRRNFTKAATEILNEYFERHLANPYPSEEAKEQLARQCNISVAQVSNWFGNKRIRFKKNMQKAQEDKEVNDVNRRNADVMAMQAAAAQSMMMPTPFIDPSLMGAAPFYYPPYDPMQMLHHHPPPPHPPHPPSQ